jgi:hypothetical protein
MSAKIFLTFSDIKGGDPHEFAWVVRDTSLAQRWMGEEIFEDVVDGRSGSGSLLM